LGQSFSLRVIKYQEIIMAGTVNFTAAVDRDWMVQIVDMVQLEVTRTKTPTSHAIATWIKKNKLHEVTTKTHQHYRRTQATSSAPLRKSNAVIECGN